MDEEGGGGDWRSEAACRGMDSEIFFPAGEDNLGRHLDVYEMAPEAVFVCGTCPVMQECRDEAILFGEVGVWGGTGTEQRRVIRKALGLAVDEIGALNDEG